MRSAFALLLALDLLTRPACAQSSTATNASPTPVTQSAFDRLTQSNRDLLDLLKKQQAVLEDIQYDRRLQDRRIQTLEERLTESIETNGQLQAKIAQLEATAAAGPTNTNTATTTPAAEPTPTPAPPSTYLPPPESPGAAGTLSWHRLFTLSGEDGRSSDMFHIQGRQWRVLWHNQDKPGDAYQNTSALFIDAFPKDDTIPQKVCSKLGSGGDSTELLGPGNYYLKIEASGGNWELAVEDFR